MNKISFEPIKAWNGSYVFVTDEISGRMESIE